MEVAGNLEQQKRRGISGSTLKMIAIVTMLIDHIGAVVLARYLMANGFRMIVSSTDANLIQRWLMENYVLYYTYYIMRMIGRIAFPIFCFLLVEGFTKTSNVRKYALRLGIFALVSEIPFDLALKSEISFEYQNVFFTLLIGLFTMMAFDWLGKRSFPVLGKLLLGSGFLAAGMGLAVLLKTDYDWKGIMAIIVIYLLRKNKIWQVIGGCIAFLWEQTAFFAFIPIVFYNGKRGLKMKYFFYVFYPAHLLVLFLLCVILGISGYSAV